MDSADLSTSHSVHQEPEDEFKRAAQAQWDRCAQGWNDHTPEIRAWLREPTAAMIAMAGVRPGHRVLDVAAGAGDQTIDLAAAAGPTGEVLATDFCEPLLALAQANARRQGLANVHTQLADAEALDVPREGFDAAVCRLGLMLLAQPLRALRGMHQALRPGGGVGVLVFSEPQANPCVGLLMATALAHAGLPPRDPFQPGSLFSLGRPGVLEALLREAGFTDVGSMRLQAPFELPSASHYLAFVRDSASPIQQILSRLDAPEREAAWADMEAKLRRFDTEQGWCGPNELLVGAGRR